MFKVQCRAERAVVRSSGLPSCPVVILFDPKGRHTPDLTVSLPVDVAQDLFGQLEAWLKRSPLAQADGDGG